jgi:hypothetical protein
MEILYTIIECIMALVLILIGVIFVYMSDHIIQEEKQGKRLPLFWEKKDGE